MPTDENKTVDIDTSGPGAEIDVPEEKDESVVETEPKETKRIAILKGHGELDTLQIAGLTSELLSKYQVFNVDLTRKQNLLKNLMEN